MEQHESGYQIILAITANRLSVAVCQVGIESFRVCRFALSAGFFFTYLGEWEWEGAEVFAMI